MNPTTYVENVKLTGGTTGGTFGTAVSINLNSKARNILGLIYSGCDTVFTTAQGNGGDQLQISSSSLGITSQILQVGPYNTSGPATNSSGQSNVVDVIPFEALIKPKGNEQITFSLASGDTITTGHAGILGVMYCQDLPPTYWCNRFPVPVAFRGGYVSEAQQLTTTATALTAISIPSWVNEIVACRAIVLKSGAITTAQYEQGYFSLLSTIPDIAPMKIPTNSDGAALGTPVGTGMYHDSMPYIPIYFLNPGGTQTITPTINLTAAVSTGNDVSFGAYWR